MEIKLPGFEEVEASEGFKLLAPGKYRVIIAEPPEVGVNNNGNPEMVITMKVIGGPKQEDGSDPAGSTIKDWIYYTKAMWKLKNLLVSAGIIPKDDKTSDIARGQFDSDILTGQECVINLTASTYNGKEKRDVQYVLPE